MYIKYQPILMSDEEEELNFVRSFFGCRVMPELELWPGVRCSIWSQAGSPVQALLIPPGSPVNNKNVIILNTSYCLRDYHDIKNRGVRFKSPPEYGPFGLKAEFEDQSGNYYILLEQREYED